MVISILYYSVARLSSGYARLHRLPAMCSINYTIKNSDLAVRIAYLRVWGGGGGGGGCGGVGVAPSVTKLCFQGCFINCYFINYKTGWKA